jgi:hypothetical protein
MKGFAATLALEAPRQSTSDMCGGSGFWMAGLGLVFHFLQGFWHRFLADAKLVEWQRVRRCSLKIGSRATTPEPNSSSAAVRDQENSREPSTLARSS